MADNVIITQGTGTTVAADEVVDGTLGTVKVQYVKLMDGTLDGTNKAVVGSNGLKVDGSGVTQPVSGTFFQATQPISAASLPLPTGAATSANQTTELASLSSIDSKTPALVNGLQPVLSNQQPASLSVTATGAAAAAVTLTLPAVAGQFHYITLIEIQAYSTAARTGGTTPVIVTSTNLAGSNAWTFASGAAIGTTDAKVYVPALPIKSAVANTATTIVCPATAAIIWRCNVFYYAGV